MSSEGLPERPIRLSDRDTALTRIRAAVAGTPPVEVPRAYRRGGGPPPGDPSLVDLLADRLADYRATVHRVALADVAGTVGAIFTVAGPVVDRPSVVVPPGLPADWLPPTLDAIRDAGLANDALTAVDGVVTGAALAIAETGTLVLDGSPDQGRRVITLLPDLHVCVLTAAQVIGTVPEALTRLTPGRPLTWISGPSATSDIEFNRVEGVHGPRRLHVVII